MNKINDVRAYALLASGTVWVVACKKATGGGSDFDLDVF